MNLEVLDRQHAILFLQLLQIISVINGYTNILADRNVMLYL